MSFETQDAKRMPTEKLENHIIQFLKEQNMCVLATCSDGVPRATPIEYHSKGITMYFVGEPGAKMKNIANNPNVSIGIFLPYTGWDSAKGAQITGKATIISRTDLDEFREGLEAYQWEKTAKELNIKEFPNTVELIKVEPEKIEYVDMSLKKLGYNPRQVYTLFK
ncbi:MAG: pyridoxamine 5'-phosphate oxidase family protein [Candidatus Bathyarchaeia archaeon]|jgi:nitroimidazol reductase NimA-like FMN-containing flavoprotein (pyridoxamine 5'-phosphate oxidase superfamily)